METIDLINALNDAIATIIKARIDNGLCNASATIWALSKHAEQHLDAQIKTLLAPDPEPEPQPITLNDRFRASIKSVGAPCH